MLIWFELVIICWDIRKGVSLVMIVENGVCCDIR